MAKQRRQGPSFAVRALSRRAGERLSLRRETAEMERPDSSELGGGERETEAAIKFYYADGSFHYADIHFFSKKHIELVRLKFFITENYAKLRRPKFSLRRITQDLCPLRGRSSA